MGAENIGGQPQLQMEQPMGQPNPALEAANLKSGQSSDGVRPLIGENVPDSRIDPNALTFHTDYGEVVKAEARDLCKKDPKNCILLGNAKTIADKKINYQDAFYGSLKSFVKKFKFFTPEFTRSTDAWSDGYTKGVADDMANRNFQGYAPQQVKNPTEGAEIGTQERENVGSSAGAGNKVINSGSSGGCDADGCHHHHHDDDKENDGGVYAHRPKHQDNMNLWQAKPGDDKDVANAKKREQKHFKQVSELDSVEQDSYNTHRKEALESGGDLQRENIKITQQVEYVKMGLIKHATALKDLLVSGNRADLFQKLRLVLPSDISEAKLRQKIDANSNLPIIDCISAVLNSCNYELTDKVLTIAEYAAEREVAWSDDSEGSDLMNDQVEGKPGEYKLFDHDQGKVVTVNQETKVATEVERDIAMKAWLSVMADFEDKLLEQCDAAGNPLAVRFPGNTYNCSLYGENPHEVSRQWTTALQLKWLGNRESENGDNIDARAPQHMFGPCGAQQMPSWILGGVLSAVHQASALTSLWGAHSGDFHDVAGLQGDSHTRSYAFVREGTELHKQYAGANKDAVVKENHLFMNPVTGQLERGHVVKIDCVHSQNFLYIEGSEEEMSRNLRRLWGYPSKKAEVKFNSFATKENGTDTDYKQMRGTGKVAPNQVVGQSRLAKAPTTYQVQSHTIAKNDEDKTTNRQELLVVEGMELFLEGNCVANFTQNHDDAFHEPEDINDIGYEAAVNKNYGHQGCDGKHGQRGFLGGTIRDKFLAHDVDGKGKDREDFLNEIEVLNQQLADLEIGADLDSDVEKTLFDKREGLHSNLGEVKRNIDKAVRDLQDDIEKRLERLQTMVSSVKGVTNEEGDEIGNAWFEEFKQFQDRQRACTKEFVNLKALSSREQRNQEINKAALAKKYALLIQQNKLNVEMGELLKQVAGSPVESMNELLKTLDDLVTVGGNDAENIEVLEGFVTDLKKSLDTQPAGELIEALLEHRKNPDSDAHLVKTVFGSHRENIKGALLALRHFELAYNVGTKIEKMYSEFKKGALEDVTALDKRVDLFKSRDSLQGAIVEAFKEVIESSKGNEDEDIEVARNKIANLVTPFSGVHEANLTAEEQETLNAALEEAKENNTPLSDIEISDELKQKLLTAKLDLDKINNSSVDHLHFMERTLEGIEKQVKQDAVIEEAKQAFDKKKQGLEIDAAKDPIYGNTPHFRASPAKGSYDTTRDRFTIQSGKKGVVTGNTFLVAASTILSAAGVMASAVSEAFTWASMPLAGSLTAMGVEALMKASNTGRRLDRAETVTVARSEKISQEADKRVSKYHLDAKKLEEGKGNQFILQNISGVTDNKKDDNALRIKIQKVRDDLRKLKTLHDKERRNESQQAELDKLIETYGFGDRPGTRFILEQKLNSVLVEMDRLSYCYGKLPLDVTTYQIDQTEGSALAKEHEKHFATTRQELSHEGIFNQYGASNPTTVSPAHLASRIEAVDNELSECLIEMAAILPKSETNGLKQLADSMKVYRDDQGKTDFTGKLDNLQAQHEGCAMALKGARSMLGRKFTIEQGRKNNEVSRLTGIGYLTAGALFLGSAAVSAAGYLGAAVGAAASFAASAVASPVALGVLVATYSMNAYNRHKDISRYKQIQKQIEAVEPNELEKFLPKVVGYHKDDVLNYVENKIKQLEVERNRWIVGAVCLTGVLAASIAGIAASGGAAAPIILGVTGGLAAGASIPLMRETFHLFNRDSIWGGNYAPRFEDSEDINDTKIDSPEDLKKGYWSKGKMGPLLDQKNLKVQRLIADFERDNKANEDPGSAYNFTKGGKSAFDSMRHRDRDQNSEPGVARFSPLRLFTGGADKAQKAVIAQKVADKKEASYADKHTGRSSFMDWAGSNQKRNEIGIWARGMWKLAKQRVVYPNRSNTMLADNIAEYLGKPQVKQRNQVRAEIAYGMSDYSLHKLNYLQHQKDQLESRVATLHSTKLEGDDSDYNLTCEMALDQLDRVKTQIQDMQYAMSLLEDYKAGTEHGNVASTKEGTPEWEDVAMTFMLATGAASHLLQKQDLVSCRTLIGQSSKSLVHKLDSPQFNALANFAEVEKYRHGVGGMFSHTGRVKIGDVKGLMGNSEAKNQLKQLLFKGSNGNPDVFKQAVNQQLADSLVFVLPNVERNDILMMAERFEIPNRMDLRNIPARVGWHNKMGNRQYVEMSADNNYHFVGKKVNVEGEKREPRVSKFLMDRMAANNGAENATTAAAA